MSSEAIGNALRIIAMHEFNATPLYDGVVIEMPFSVDGVDAGVELIECRTYREVFAALGY
jgi:hypothetical protein